MKPQRSLLDIVQSSTSSYTTLVKLTDCAPQVTVTEQDMTYYSIHNGYDVCYLEDLEDAQETYRVMEAQSSYDANRQDRVIAHGVQEHHGTIPVYTLQEYSSDHEALPPVQILDTNILEERMKIAYIGLHDAETRAAELMGFASLHEAIQHEHVQHMLQHYTIAELLTLEDTDFYADMMDAYSDVMYYTAVRYPDLTNISIEADKTAEHIPGIQNGNYLYEHNVPLVEERLQSTYRKIFYELYQRLMHLSEGELHFPMPWVYILIEETMQDLSNYATEDIAQLRRDLSRIAHESDTHKSSYLTKTDAL